MWLDATEDHDESIANRRLKNNGTSILLFCMKERISWNWKWTFYEIVSYNQSIAEISFVSIVVDFQIEYTYFDVTQFSSIIYS
jgi:hypothetical protein